MATVARQERAVAGAQRRGHQHRDAAVRHRCGELPMVGQMRTHAEPNKHFQHFSTICFSYLFSVVFFIFILM